MGDGVLAGDVGDAVGKGVGEGVGVGVGEGVGGGGGGGGGGEFGISWRSQPLTTRLYFWDFAVMECPITFTLNDDRVESTSQRIRSTLL